MAIDDPHGLLPLLKEEPVYAVRDNAASVHVLRILRIDFLKSVSRACSDEH